MQKRYPERSHSPNTVNRSHLSSVQSQHLWNTLDDIEMFSSDVYDLLKNEDRNIAAFKQCIEREKYQANQAIENTKQEVLHHIDDFKISILAELDQVYKLYMEKYAGLKGEIMDLKRVHDEIQMEFSSKTRSLPAAFNQHSTAEFTARKSGNGLLPASNVHVIRSLEQNLIEMKKYHMLNYVSELQKQKILPINQITRELMVLTQYQNEFFFKRDFDLVSSKLLTTLRASLREMHLNKHDFLRDPVVLCSKDEPPVLEGVYDYPQKDFEAHKDYLREIPVKDQFKKQNSPYNAPNEANMPFKLSKTQQTASLDWAQSIRVSQAGCVRTDSSDILLCAIEAKKNVIAIGSKSGDILIYDVNSGAKINVLKAHTVSICTLALVSFQGSTLLAAGSDNGCNSISLWDVNTWKFVGKLLGHKSAVTAVVDLEDGEHIASGSYDKKINVYSLQEKKLSYNLPANKSAVTGIIMNSTSSKLISSGLDNTLNIWQVVRNSSRQVETLCLERIMQNSTMICSIACSLKEDSLFIGTMDGKIKLINIDKAEAYKTVSCCDNAIIEMVVVERNSHPGLPIVLCRPCKEDCIKIVNTETGRVSTTEVSGNIEFGCGIGPKSFFMRQSRLVAMVSQSEQQKDVRLYKMDVA